MFESMQDSKVAGDVIHRIVDMIRSQPYAPGDRLPSERVLAEQLGVSRTTVRDALGRLQTMGLIQSRAGLGSYVQDPARGALHASLAPHILTDPAKMRQVFEVREIIEVDAASRAAERATAAQISSIRHWCEQVEISIARNDRAGRSQGDVEFHRQIVIATGNQLLVDLIDSMAGLLREMRTHALNMPNSGPEVIDAHRAIVAAIEAHSPEAARQAMQAHLDTVRTRAQDYFGAEASPRGE